MLNAESFRIPQEIELSARIKAHSAWAAMQEVAAAAGRAVLGPDQVETTRAEHRLTRQAQPEVWAAIEHAMALFGVRQEFVPIVVDVEADMHQAVMITAVDDPLQVRLARATLAHLRVPELTSAIGHALGHFLLGHAADAELSALLALARAEVEDGDDRCEELWQDPASAELLGLVVALAQLQDLSADRIALLVSRDLNVTLRAVAQLFSAVPIHVEFFLNTGQRLAPALLWAERACRPHPALPHRVRLLTLFAESALFRAAVGLAGGYGADELALRVAPTLPQGGSFWVYHLADLDELLLELILMDSLVFASQRRRPRAAQMLSRYLTPGLYTPLIAHYDTLVDDSDDAADVLQPWLQHAARKSVIWKAAMIERFLYLSSLDYRLDDQTLGEVATLAVAMGAQEECRKICAQGFGYDPFHWREAAADDTTAPAAYSAAY